VLATKSPIKGLMPNNLNGGDRTSLQTALKCFEACVFTSVLLLSLPCFQLGDPRFEFWRAGQGQRQRRQRQGGASETEGQGGRRRRMGGEQRTSGVGVTGNLRQCRGLTSARCRCVCLWLSLLSSSALTRNTLIQPQRTHVHLRQFASSPRFASAV
jgi:hypothetical protein